MEEQNKLEHHRPEFSSLSDSALGIVAEDQNDVEHDMLDKDIHLLKTRVCNNAIVPVDTETKIFSTDNTEECEANEKRVPNAVLPLLRYYQYESSESSYR